MTRNYEGKLRQSTKHLIAQAFQGPADTKKRKKKCALALDLGVELGYRTKSSLFFLVGLEIICLWKKRMPKSEFLCKSYAHFTEHNRKVVCYSPLKLPKMWKIGDGMAGGVDIMMHPKA